MSALYSVCPGARGEEHALVTFEYVMVIAMMPWVGLVESRHLTAAFRI
jgi:hypothetical protein